MTSRSRIHILFALCCIAALQSCALFTDVPPDAERFKNNGMILASRGEYDRAITRYTRALQMMPNDEELYNYRGTAYLNGGYYSAALADYTVAITIDPSYSLAYYNRAITFERLQDVQGAIADYTSVINLYDEELMAEAYTARGWDYYRLQEYEKAADDYRSALELAPTAAGVLISRGILYRDMEDYNLALSDFNEALEIDSTLSGAYIQRAYVHQRREEYEEAMRNYHRAAELDTSNPEVYWYRAETYRAMENDSLAFADYTRAFEMDSNYVYARLQRGYIHLRQDDAAAALEEFNYVADKDSTISSAYYGRSNAFKMQGDYDRARADLRKYILYNPNSPDGYMRLASLETDRKNYDDAVFHYRRALEVDSANSSAYGNMGWAQYLAGDFKKSLENSQRAIELDKDAYYARFNIALVHLRNGETEKARNLYSEILNLIGENAERENSVEGAIGDIEELIEQNIMVKESRAVLKDIFKREYSGKK